MLPELFRRASHVARQATALGVPWSLWDGDRHAVDAEDLEMLADLRRALYDGALRLAYQMQVPAGADRGLGRGIAEVGPRRHGPVPPGRFIGLAERTGLVPRITEWVLGEALDAQVRWRARGLDLPVSVNVSAKDLADADLVRRVLEGLSDRGLPSSCLTVEVTESAVTDPGQALAVLGPLRSHGVRISVDDFGTGFTSLAALPDLPLDELKIDQLFVRRALGSPADDAIVATTCDLAHRLGLVVVAEGVEHGAVADRMAELGVDLLQGYHLARPLDETALLEALGASAGRPSRS